MFQNQQLFFYICTIAVLIVGVAFYIRCKQDEHLKLLRITMILILSGAVGNFIYRLRFEYVIVFVYFKLIDFPVFNIADCYITIGFVFMIILILFVYKDEDLSCLSLKRETPNKQ